MACSGPPACNSSAIDRLSSPSVAHSRQHEVKACRDPCCQALMSFGTWLELCCRYAYDGRPDRPPDLPEGAAVDFEVELISFERQPHWQNEEPDKKIRHAGKVYPSECKSWLRL